MKFGPGSPVDARLVRAVTAFAAVMALCLAVAMPAVYLLSAWQREHARSLAEATVTSAIITELATRNPELWRFEGHRVQGILAISTGAARQRVLAGDGEVLAELGEDSFPAVTASAPFFDGNQEVGRVEIGHSFRGPLLETLVVGAIAFVLAAGAFLALRIVPLRLLAQTFAGLLHAVSRAERAQAEAQLALGAAEAANRGRGHFLAAMNHEFRTPISQVSGFSALLLNEALAGRAGAARIEWLRDIDAASRHLLDLLEDATRYATLDEAATALHPYPTGLRVLAESGIELARSALERGGIRTEVKLIPEDGLLKVDTKLIGEALACLLRDLARRAPPGARFCISCVLEDGAATISLECSEIQLSAAGLDALRNPLETPEVRARGLEGSGLGVAVADRIARLHGGTLRVGALPDGGTCMSLHLPVPQGDVRRPAAA